MLQQKLNECWESPNCPKTHAQDLTGYVSHTQEDDFAVQTEHIIQETD